MMLGGEDSVRLARHVSHHERVTLLNIPSVISVGLWPGKIESEVAARPRSKRKVT